MRIEIEIPKEFECDYDADKFRDFFSRAMIDIETMQGMCGRYEVETAEMFRKAFAESKIAYDVEAVVAKLEKMKKESIGCTGVSCDNCKYKGSCMEGEESFKVALDRAADVFRNGGKDALKGCGNCKHQPEPLTTCDWLKSQTVVFKECPRWERKE